MSACLRAALVPLLLAAPALGNEARIQQSGGAMGDFTLDQAPGGGHRFVGLGGITGAPGRPAMLSGDFETLRIVQDGGASTVALDVAVTAPSAIDIETGGSGADSIRMEAIAGDLNSTVRTEGAGVRDVDLKIDAAGASVYHDLLLRGDGNLNAEVTQQNGDASLEGVILSRSGASNVFVTQDGSVRADLTVEMDSASTLTLLQSGDNNSVTLEADMASLSAITINQNASNAVADIDATLGERASFTLNQLADGVSAVFRTEIGAGGSLTVNQTEANNVITNQTTPNVTSVGADHTVTVNNGSVSVQP